MKATPLILILVSAGLFYTFIMPKYGEVQTLSAEIDEYEHALDNADNIRATMDMLTQDYESIPPEELERLEKAVPDTVNGVRLAVDLDGIAASYGVSIREISVEKQNSSNSSDGSINTGTAAAINQGKQIANVTFTFVSDYADFRSILSDVEESLRIIDVESVTFTTTANVTGAGPRVASGLYEHSISVLTYWVE